MEYVLAIALLWLFLGFTAVLVTFWMPSLIPKLLALSRWAHSRSIEQARSYGISAPEARRRIAGHTDEWYLSRARKVLVVSGLLAFLLLWTLWRMKEFSPPPR